MAIISGILIFQFCLLSTPGVLFLFLKPEATYVCIVFFQLMLCFSPDFPLLDVHEKKVLGRCDFMNSSDDESSDIVTNSDSIIIPDRIDVSI